MDEAHAQATAKGTDAPDGLFRALLPCELAAERELQVSAGNPVTTAVERGAYGNVTAMVVDVR